MFFIKKKIEFAECGNCHAVLRERGNLPLEHRSPCPNCASLSRFHSREMTETIHMHDMVKALAKDKSNKRKIQVQSGSDFHRDSQTWRKLERVIDWTRNWYTERITSLDGSVVFRKVDEPLSEHVGRGSAKKRS